MGPHDGSAVTLYLAVLVLMGWTFNAIWFSARRMGLVDDTNPEETKAISWSYPSSRL